MLDDLGFVDILAVASADVGVQLAADATGDASQSGVSSSRCADGTDNTAHLLASSTASVQRRPYPSLQLSGCSAVACWVW